MSEDGEIPLLDADNLLDHKGMVGSEDATPEESAGDDRAIRVISTKLSALPASGKLSHEEIEDRAIEIYNRSCQLVLAEKGNKHLLQLAELVDEDPELLLQRLQAEEGGGEDSGAGGLLRALLDS